MGDVETVGGALKQFIPMLAPGDCGRRGGKGSVKGQVTRTYLVTTRHVARI